MAGAPEFVDGAPLGSVLKAVSGDSADLAAEPPPPPHPQPQSPSVMKITTNRNESDLLGLKQAGSDAWQAILPAALRNICACNLDLQRENSGRA